jgi:hypothetical protein
LAQAGDRTLELDSLVEFDLTISGEGATQAVEKIWVDDIELQSL